MRNNQVKKLVILAFITALSVVLGNFLKIPTPTGFLTLLDAGIYFTAFYFGRKEAAIVGSLSGFLIDMIAGYPQWMIFSFEGKSRYLGLVLAAAAMVGGYALFGSIMNGVGAALAEISSNFMQNAFGLAVGFALYKAFPESLKKAVAVK